jgi:hypothetical protein
LIILLLLLGESAEQDNNSDTENAKCEHIILQEVDLKELNDLINSQAKEKRIYNKW